MSVDALVRDFSVELCEEMWIVLAAFTTLYNHGLAYTFHQVAILVSVRIDHFWQVWPMCINTAIDAHQNPMALFACLQENCSKCLILWFEEVVGECDGVFITDLKGLPNKVVLCRHMLPFLSQATYSLFRDRTFYPVSVQNRSLKGEGLKSGFRIQCS